MGSKGLNLIKGLNLKSGMMGGGSGYADDPRMLRLKATVLEAGDMLFFDKIAHKYVVVKKDNVASVLTGGYDTTRYETNFDSFIGTLDGMAHFVARDDAAPTQSLYSNDVAATSCYYRIEIDNTQAGSITFSVASGNGSIASTTISWEANEAMATIVAKFTAKNATSNYITFAGLEDGTGVGLEVGGYGANTMTVTASENCTVIDCSTLAFYASENPAAPGVGGTFVPTASWTFIGNAHHNWRGATARTILGQNLVGDSTTLIANDGYNYSYRCGGNFANFKSWASVSGESTFNDDGEGGSIANPGAHVMNEATFNLGVRDYTGEDSAHLGMKEYYTHLTTDTTGDFAAMRATYEARYGQMTSMYDAYLMSHMVDPGANSGIANSMRNKGKRQTEVKADAMNVTYNYVILPAYPPEYNAAHYGSAITEGFQAGTYYHPEPGDIGLFMRDDIMATTNANIALSGGGTAIVNTASKGSCADYGARGTWCFNSTNGCVDTNFRYYGYFRSRPVLALPIND